MISLTASKALFPKISRFITEKGKIFIIIFSSGVVILGIVLQGIKLHDNLEKIELQKMHKATLTKELSYWQSIARQYPNYRDVYFRIANLQYQLGEKAEAKKSIEKVLAIDPNFEAASVLGAAIEAR
jgi:tetratricopeptide (TPR) repeat protein